MLAADGRKAAGPQAKSMVSVGFMVHARLAWQSYVCCTCRGMLMVRVRMSHILSTLLHAPGQPHTCALCSHDLLHASV